MFHVLTFLIIITTRKRVNFQGTLFAVLRKCCQVWLFFFHQFNFSDKHWTDRKDKWISCQQQQLQEALLHPSVFWQSWHVHITAILSASTGQLCPHSGEIFWWQGFWFIILISSRSTGLSTPPSSLFPLNKGNWRRSLKKQMLKKRNWINISCVLPKPWPYPKI